MSQKKWLVGFFSALLFVSVVKADVLAAWNFFGNTAPESAWPVQVPDDVHADVSVSSTSLGAGLYQSVGITNTWILRGLSETSLVAAVAADDYFSFSITPNLDHQVTITNLSFYAARNSSLSPTVTLMTSVDGFTDADAISSVSITVNNPASPGLYELSGLNLSFSAETEVRIYLHGTSAEGNPVWFGDSDTDLGNTSLNVEGTVTQYVPSNLIAGWNFYGNTSAESNGGQAPDISHSNVVISTAVKALGVQYMAAGNPDTWTIRGLSAATLEDAIAADDFVYFTITPDEGYQVTITNLAFYGSRNDTVDAQVDLFTAVDGFTAGDVVDSVSVNTANHPNPTLFEMSDLNITFTNTTQVRLYLYGLTDDIKPLWFGDSDTDLGNTGIRILGTVDVPNSEEGYSAWAAGWGAIGSETDDPDEDGLSNLAEYALGGNPTNSADRGEASVFAKDENVMIYVHPKYKHDASLVYYLESTEDLLVNNWTNSGYTVIGTNVASEGDFDYITNSIPLEKEKTFMRLTVEN